MSFYRTDNGHEIVRDFLRALTEADRSVIGEDLKTLQYRYPLGMPLCRPLKSGLWELRSSLPSKREARLIYCFYSPRQMIVVVHAFIKKTRTTPDADLKLAQRRQREFLPE